ncbi:MAG: MFS transporter [Parcubacteria group bacterium]
MGEKDSRVNMVIRKLVVADFLFWFSPGMLTPVFAVFVLENIENSKLEMVGIAFAMYWLARVLTTVPISRFMDRTRGKKDEFFFLLAGALMWAIVPLFFLLATLPIHLYIIQFLLGIAGSLQIPAWRILFTYHIDKEKIGYEWSLDDLSVGVATGTAAFVGSFIASRLGFDYVFVALSAVYLIGAVVVASMYSNISMSEKKSIKERHKELSLHKKKHIRLKVRGV